MKRRSARSPKSRLRSLSARADASRPRRRSGEAKASYQQAKDELDIKSELQRRNPGIVPQRDIEKLAGAGRPAAGRCRRCDCGKGIGGSAGFDAAAGREGQRRSRHRRRPRSISTRPSFGPASTGALSSSVVRAGDVVNQMMRPAGVLIPDGAGRTRAAGRIRPDRGPGHEAGHDRRSNLHLETVGDHSAGRHRAFRTISPPASSAAASN